MDKTPMNKLAAHLGGARGRAQAAVREGTCMLCGKGKGEHRDEVARREYLISGTCQACQDGVFGGEE